MFSLSRSLALAVAAALAAAGAPLQADDNSLPEIGSSAAELLSPAQETAYGRQMLGELRRAEYLLEDPLLEAWLGALGQGLAARSERPSQPFTFFLIRSREINAFATLGGYIGVNAGLVLTAEREDEVAAVLAHEIAHVTQRHIVRGVEAAQKDTLPIALAMLGAIVASQSSKSSADATQAAITSGIALMQQRQINFTRAHEAEADRVGINNLGRAGYDPMGMADFFGRMLRATRSQGDAVPDFLRSHPVTTTRISEAKDRADAVAQRTARGARGGSAQPLNPILSAAFSVDLEAARGPDTRAFAFARERLRVLSAPSPADALAEYRRRSTAGETPSDAERYGAALAAIQVGDSRGALHALAALAPRHADFFWIDLARAEALHAAGEIDAAEREYHALLLQQPRNRAIALSFAARLAQQGTAAAGRQAQDVLRPLLANRMEDAALQHAFARACEQAGDLVRAAEAYAEASFLSGHPEDALNQLQRLKEREDLDYVQRARVDARIAAMTPTVLELRARGIKPGDERPSGMHVGMGWRAPHDG